jgi:heme oxygenase
MPEANVPSYAKPVTQGPRRGLLWAQLRESTRDAHAQAEASLATLAQPDNLARYVVLLCVLWGFQAPLERLLGHHELPSAVDWPARQRLGALAADLTDLGVTGISLPEATGLPALTGPGAVWGTCT